MGHLPCALILALILAGAGRGKRTPRTPVRAHVPLLPSGPGGVGGIHAVRRVSGQSSGPRRASAANGKSGCRSCRAAAGTPYPGDGRACLLIGSAGRAARGLRRSGRTPMIPTAPCGATRISRCPRHSGTVREAHVREAHTRGRMFARRRFFGPVGLPAEDSPSGLGRTLGKRVGGNPSRVRISHPPPRWTAATSACLPSINTRLRPAGQGAVGGDQVDAVGLARAGLAAEQDVALGQVAGDQLARPFSSHSR